MKLICGERDVYAGGLPSDMYDEHTTWAEQEAEWQEMLNIERETGA